jgi:hypothetical protein
MISAVDPPWRYIILWLRIVFGVHLAYSGLALVFGEWIPVKLAQGTPGAGTFMVALADIGLYQIVKYIELLVGFMLIFNIAVPLALLLELPITIVIAYLNILVDASERQLFTGPQELFLNASLLVAYGGYYGGFLQLKATPRWLWHPAGFAASASVPGPASRHTNLVAWSAIIAMALIVVVASLALGPPERRLPPRDYVPLLLAAAFVAYAQWRELRQRSESLTPIP